MSADTPRTRCEYYRRTCHLPATVEPNTGSISVRAGLVWGIELPSEIAQLVKIDLDRRRHGGGPIICHPRNATWTFLVRSDIPATVIAREAPLWRNRVKILERGTSIALPSPCGRGVFYRGWISATHGPYRPSGMSVVDSIRTVLLAFADAETTTRLPVLGTQARTGSPIRAAHA